MWLVAVAGAELDKDGCCNLLEAMTEDLCMDIHTDSDGINICVAKVEIGGAQQDWSVL